MKPSLVMIIYYMVTRYDVISIRWLNHFWVKMHFFSSSFNNKSKYCDKMMQSASLCVMSSTKKISIYCGFNVITNRPFPSSPEPLFQNEGRCSAFDMEIIFHSNTNKTHFHKKGCAPSLILKVRVFGTRNWPILGKIQDGDHCWWHHRPPVAPPAIKYTSSC